MRISRREFLKYCSVAAGALGLTTTDLLKIEDALGKTGDPDAPHVVWIPGQACTGCTMSLTNSVFYTTVDDIALNLVNLDYNEQLNAAAGEKAVDAAISAIGKPMVLALEGAIPHGSNGEDEFCTIWTRTSGIIAAKSKINGTTVADGTLTRKLPSTTLIPNDVIKAGSELAATQVLPAGTTVKSAADRAALGGTYAGGSSLGSDILNTEKLAAGALLTTGSVGDIYVYGGTDGGYPSGSVIATGTIFDTYAALTSNSNFHDSFDRAVIDGTNPGSAAPTVVGGTLVWERDMVNGGMYLTVQNPIGTLVAGTVQLNSTRALSGFAKLAPNVVFGANTKFQTGTKVVNGTDQLQIDPTLAAFGFEVDDTGEVLTTPSTALAADYVLTGDVIMPSYAIVASLVAPTTNHDKTILNEAILFGTSAAAILCVGTCASFGGIPASKGNLTNASGALYQGLTKPGAFNGPSEMVDFAAKTINISGCPPHPDWIVGTIAFLLKTNFQIPPLEAYARPMSYYGQYQCNAGPCEWRYNQGYTVADEGNYFNPKVHAGSPNSSDTRVTGKLPGAAGYATVNSSKLYKYKWANDSNGRKYLGCIGVLGCKGRKTKADCSLRRWNGDAALQYGTNWCVGSGAGCHGCTEPTFPDKVGKFFNFA